MTTEYRPGIPSHAHVTAAERLGLEWDEHRDRWRHWRFAIRNDEVWCDFATARSRWDGYLSSLASGLIADRANIEHYRFRPIRPDGTPVDWETLDAEVARAGQAFGPQCKECDGAGRIYGATHDGSRTCGECRGTGRQPATVTPAAPAAPTTQPQGFRADLWRRLVHNLFGDSYPAVQGQPLEWFLEPSGATAFSWNDGPTVPSRTDILARWTVYQELKPLYDIVDGAQGEAAMPQDVEAAWMPGFSVAGYYLSTTARGNLCASGPGEHDYYPTDGTAAGMRLRNFAAVLDAVAERRVAERMRGQTQAPTVTSGLPPAPIGTVMVQDVDGTVRPARMNDTARVIGLAGIDMPAAVRPAAQPEPRRFADARPDRHGWRWWLVRHALPLHQTWLRIDHNRPYDWSTVETVIPTDEQGNPVSWGAAGFAAEAVLGAQERVQRAANDAMSATGGQFSNNPTTPPLTPEGLLSAMQNYAVPGIHITVGTGAKPAHTEAITALPMPLPRFTADELDDVDHSKTTKLDEVMRRGKLPTVEQIAKYREVRARRINGTVADALKESRIDCEVAQYVLERWAGGLGGEEAQGLCKTIARYTSLSIKSVEVDTIVLHWLNNTTLDTTEPPDTAAQQARQQAEERRQRLAQVQAQIAAERAAVQPQDASEPSRFDLIEPDPQADPAASIRAWEARQAAAKRAPATVATMPARPTAVPHKPAIEVVDAETDGLSRGEVLAALLGHAMHGGC